MTTIAWDGEFIAADSRSTYHNNAVDKLTVLQDGSVVGGAGKAEHIRQAIRALQDGAEYSTDSDNFTLLRAFPDGHAEFCHGMMEWMPVSGRFFSIGSGSDYAMGALAALTMAAPGENSAEVAVLLASTYDGATGGGIRSVKVVP